MTLVILYHHPDLYIYICMYFVGHSVCRGTSEAAIIASHCITSRARIRVRGRRVVIRGNN